MTASPKICVEGLNKEFSREKDGQTVQVLRKISLTIYEGDFYCLLGPSGCGKSTLLNILAGFERPTSGKVLLNGKEISAPGTDRTVIFQDVANAIFPWLTAIENVEYGPRMAGIKKNERRKLAQECLNLVGLNRDVSKFPNELSGGMKQRIQIARAIANNPEILLMDEPFAALDAITKRLLQNELLQIWKRTHKTIFYITHDIIEALSLGTRVAIMSHGPNATITEEFPVALTEPRNTLNDDFNKLFLRVEGIIEREVRDLINTCRL